MCLAMAMILSFLVSFLVLTTSTTTTTTSSSIQTSSFIQCFLKETDLGPASSPHGLLFTSNSTSYQSILQSSSRNFRFIESKTNHKPSVIVTATLESHISASVTCARKHGINLRTRSGGHDYEAMSYVSDATEPPLVVLDLAAMRSIKVNVASRRAWVQTGATVGELYYTVFKKSNGKLGFPAGTCPTVGVGGHFSGGGQGTLSRKYGLAADNVVDAIVVDVDGRILTRTTMGEDMFWAIRGGGAASFGVVVAYKVRLVEVPPVVVAFNVNRNLKQNATKLVTRWQEIAPNFDKNLIIRLVAQAYTDTSGSEDIQVAFMSLFLGDRSQLLSAMAKSFPELGLRAEDCTEMSWLESVLFFNNMMGQGVESILNRTPSYNLSFKAKSDYVTKPIGEQDWVKIWKFLMENKVEEPLFMIMEPYGGVLSEISETATPFPHRKGNLYSIQYYLHWFETDVAVSQRHLELMRKLYSFMAPFVSSNPRAAYYNYKDIDLGRTSSSYSEARVWGDKYFKNNFRRLAAVKGRVDPHNFFRNEQSIPPLIPAPFPLKDDWLEEQFPTFFGPQDGEPLDGTTLEQEDIVSGAEVA